MYVVQSSFFSLLGLAAYSVASLILFLRGVNCRSRSRRPSQVTLVVKNLPANAGDIRDMSSVPGSGRSSGEGNGNPLTPVFLREKSHGQRSLVGYSPWGHKESDMTKAT